MLKGSAVGRGIGLERTATFHKLVHRFRGQSQLRFRFVKSVNDLAIACRQPDGAAGDAALGALAIALSNVAMSGTTVSNRGTSGAAKRLATR